MRPLHFLCLVVLSKFVKSRAWLQSRLLRHNSIETRRIDGIGPDKRDWCEYALNCGSSLGVEWRIKTEVNEGRKAWQNIARKERLQ